MKVKVMTRMILKFNLQREVERRLKMAAAYWGGTRFTSFTFHSDLHEHDLYYHDLHDHDLQDTPRLI